MNLLNCVPCAPLRLLVFPIIDSALRACTPVGLRALLIVNTHLMCLAPLHSSISALRAFVLPCFVLLQVKSKVPMFLVCGSNNRSSPVSLLSFILPYKAVLHAFFHSYILSRVW